MDKNFRIETDLYSKIKRGKDSQEIIAEIEAHGINNRLKSGTPLYYAVTYGQIEVVKYLLKKGADVNGKFNDEYTSLMSAIDEQNEEMVEILLENGADVKIRDSQGTNALWKANYYDNAVIVKMLLEKDADPFEILPNGKSVYEIAKAMDRENLLKLYDQKKPMNL